MRCRKCGSETSVLSTRTRAGIINRRRECVNCQERFSTKEVRNEDVARLKASVTRFMDTLSIRKE